MITRVIEYGYFQRLSNSREENGVPLEVWTVNSDAYVRTLNPYISAITTDYLHADDILGY